jgi:hypothetical protein
MPPSTEMTWLVRQGLRRIATARSATSARTPAESEAARKNTIFG